MSRDAAPEPAGLAARLEARVAPGELFHVEPDGLRCLACAHRCLIREGRRGVCSMRGNRAGVGVVPFGYVARAYVRPVEINTIYHVRPGALSLTFGMYGCDLRCPYCHNWQVSQALREGRDAEIPIDATPDRIAEEALAAGCQVVCAAYNEPMITAEWVRAVFEAARARGLTTAIISDGHSTPEALAFVRPATDVYRVDLKGWSDEQYRRLGGRVEPVWRSIAEAKRLGFWVEVVTLVVPGLNDDLDGLRRLADRLKDIDPAMPWHLNAFRPHYRMADRTPTDPAVLISAAASAYARGLDFVYVGNLDARARELCHTRCPSCSAIAVERGEYATRAVHVVGGRCASCRRPLPGLWREASPSDELPGSRDLVAVEQDA